MLAGLRCTSQGLVDSRASDVKVLGTGLALSKQSKKKWTGKLVAQLHVGIYRVPEIRAGRRDLKSPARPS